MSQMQRRNEKFLKSLSQVSSEEKNSLEKISLVELEKLNGGKGLGGTIWSEHYGTEGNQTVL